MATNSPQYPSLPPDDLGRDLTLAQPDNIWLSDLPYRY